MTYRLKPVSETGTIMVVGCGGTGGFVAEGLCRLTAGTQHGIILVDHDKVEEKNIGRQNFYPEDIGKFKSRVLAERLSRQFRVGIDYGTERIEHLPIGWRGMITIGCVDNHVARKALEAAYVSGMMATKHCYQYFSGWYIDAGNGEHHGQVLIGNAWINEMTEVFLPDQGICQKLPLPTVQQPALLVPEKKARGNDCAARVARREQSPVINRMMADLALVFVHKLLAGTLGWMGAYLDLEAGSLSTVDATPEAVGRITGQKPRSLEYRPRRRNR